MTFEPVQLQPGAHPDSPPATGKAPMRLAQLLFAIAVTACGQDQEPRATGMLIRPSTAVVDTAVSVQLMVAVSWSDGATHPADVKFSAIGGTITSTGLYRAGTVGGDYRVIASCDCGLVDTVVIRITEPAKRQRFASLVIAVSGLPNGVPAQVNVTGRGGYIRAISASATLDSLPPDDYVVQATGVATDSGSYSAAPDSQATMLAAGENKSVQVMYTRAAPTGLPPHPRVWMTPQRLTFLKAQAAANTVRWQAVKVGADAQLARGVTFQWQDAYLLPDLCLAYLGTGDARYATRAGLVLAGFSTTDNTITSDSYYGYRSWLPIVTMGLDWCYNGLPPAVRHQTASWLMDRADDVWPESNPSRVGAFGVDDPADNYYYGFLMTGPAALAAAGDDTGRGAISGRDRAAYHQALALRKWNGAVLPTLAATGAGGGWIEGTGYGVGDTWSAGRFADAFLTAGTPLDHQWFTSAVQWLLHTTMPGGAVKVPFGDQARISTAPIFAYDRIAMLDVLASAKADPTLASQVQAWLNLIGQIPTPSTGVPLVLAEELLHFDPAQSAASDLSGLPKDYYASGNGAFIYRQSWTDPTATVLAFRSGESWEGHSALDANSLRIWKGSFWVSADANIYSHSGIEQETQNYNTLTVGGTGQSHNAGGPIVGGRIVATPQVSDALVVVRGQAKGAYSSRRLTDYLRTVAYLPGQDAFVVVDRVTIADATQAKVFRWHAAGVPVINGNTFTLSNPVGDQRCVGTVLSPSDAVVGTETINLGTGGAASSSAVTVTLPTGRASDVVVTVLQCTNAPGAPFAPTATTTALATDVLIGTTHVVVPLDGTQAVRIE